MISFRPQISMFQSMSRVVVLTCLPPRHLTSADPEPARPPAPPDTTGSGGTFGATKGAGAEKPDAASDSKVLLWH